MSYFKVKEQINYRTEDSLLVMSLYLLQTTGKNEVVQLVLAPYSVTQHSQNKQNNHSLDLFECKNSISSLLIIRRALLFSHLQHSLNRILTIDTLCFLSQ